MKTYYEIRDLDHPMKHPGIYKTPAEAMKALDEISNRNKGDGNDEYWNSRRNGIFKITEELVYKNK